MASQSQPASCSCPALLVCPRARPCTGWSLIVSQTNKYINCTLQMSAQGERFSVCDIPRQISSDISLLLNLHLPVVCLSTSLLGMLLLHSLPRLLGGDPQCTIPAVQRKLLRQEVDVPLLPGQIIMVHSVATAMCSCCDGRSAFLSIFSTAVTT